MVALHNILTCFLTLGREEGNHYIFLLEGFLSSSQLDTAISAFFEYVKRLIHVRCLLSNWMIDSRTYNVPVNIFIVSKNLYLDCLLSHLIFNAFFLQVLENGPYCLLKAC